MHVCIDMREVVYENLSEVVFIHHKRERERERESSVSHISSVLHDEDDKEEVQDSIVTSSCSSSSWW